MGNDVFGEALGDAVIYTGAGEGDGCELRGGIAFGLDSELQRAVMRRGIEGGDELIYSKNYAAHGETDEQAEEAETDADD